MTVTFHIFYFFEVHIQMCIVRAAKHSLTSASFNGSSTILYICTTSAGRDREIIVILSALIEMVEVESKRLMEKRNNVP